MNTIKEEREKELIINKSKFISKTYFINSKEDALKILDNLNSEYKDATHICYAYRVDNTIKYSDDGEPNNTAGLPIYNVIDKNNLNHVLIVVIRYFGGIKLGAGGLTRAYSNSASLVINDNITELIEGYLININLDYNYIKDVEYILKDIKIQSKNFDEDITITFTLPIEKLDVIKEMLKNCIKEFNIINKTYIRK